MRLFIYLFIAFDVWRIHTIRVFLDAVRFQGLGAILDWLTARLDFMRGPRVHEVVHTQEIECTLHIHDYF